MPAILKGYFDRVYLQGIALDFDKNNNFIGKLKHINKIGAVSTYGSPWHIIAYAGDQGRAFISRGLRPCFADDCQLLWLGLYSMDNTTEKGRKEFLNQVKQAFLKF